MSLLSKPSRKPDYHLELIEGEFLLFHPGRRAILYCNQTASLIWQLCDGRRTTQEIITLLGAAYPEAGETLPAEVETTLQQFLQQGAIEWLESWKPG